MDAASNLRLIRRRLKLTQAELGKLLDMKKDMIFKCEHGKRTLSIKACHKIIKLCKMVQIDNVDLEFLRPQDE